MHKLKEMRHKIVKGTKFLLLIKFALAKNKPVGPYSYNAARLINQITSLNTAWLNTLNCKYPDLKRSGKFLKSYKSNMV